LRVSEFCLSWLEDQQYVRRAKPPQSDVWPHRARTVVRVSDKSESPSGEITIKVEEIAPPQKLLTAAQRKRIMERAFKPFAFELGWIAFEWNRLHETLCQIFADLSSDRAAAFAIWHSTWNDRSQREMLSAALRTSKLLGNLKDGTGEHIKWLLKKTNDLAGGRNNAIHAPLMFVNHAVDGGFEVHMEPSDDSDNPRARELIGKPLLRELKWYRDHASLLATFGDDLHWAQLFDEFPLPDRPDLPTIGQYQNRVAQRHKARSK
jgi:hypothetical protein